MAKVLNHCPRRCDGAAALSAQDSRRPIHSAKPIIGEESLMVTQFFVRINNDTCALCGVAIFMQIHRHRCNTWNGKIPCHMRRCEKGEKHSTHACVNVEGNTSSQCLLTNKFHGVYYALRILWGRAHQKNGVVITCVNHGLFIGSPICPHRNATTLDVEVGASFFESCMGCRGQDHIEALILGAF